MPLQTLDYDTLGCVQDGFLRACVQHELRRLARDLVGRPTITKPRKLLIEVVFKPYAASDGLCEEASLELNVRSVGVERGGGLMVRADSPDDVKQATFADVADQSGDEDESDAGND